MQSTLTRLSKRFGYWAEDHRKENAEPDALTIIFMSHFIGKNITLICGKGEEWSTEDVATDLLVVCNGDNKYSPTDVGT